MENASWSRNILLLIIDYTNSIQNVFHLKYLKTVAPNLLGISEHFHGKSFFPEPEGACFPMLPASNSTVSGMLRPSAGPRTGAWGLLA